MHVFATVPLDRGGATPPRTIRGFITDLFGPGRPSWPGDYYFVRTWDRADGLDCLQISLASDTATSGEARARIREAAEGRGLPSTAAELPLEEAPSPLWNAGVGGEGFDAAAKRLFRAVAPVLARTASAIGDDTAEAYLLALRLMVANAGATVLESEQRQLSSRGFGELLSLRLLSYRSHYEGAKNAQAKDPDSFERRCAAYYDKLGAQAREFVRNCAESPVPSAGDEPARAWVDIIQRHFGALREECRAGTVTHDGPTLDDFNEDRDASQSPSSFHARDLSAEMSDLLHRNPDFLAYRIQTSLLYSCLYTMGFNLAERFLFCYLLARANEEVSGKSTEELSEGLDAVAKEFARST
ncbi:hypothetical protein EKD16_06240 [Streptomonospora litoralis]|uniref:Thiopeptide-type bacteriocin biosynthesis domain-containing protein n=1 Tax=Streptomonospora litoralis TaxID=2498135 RepID=A0A4P6PXQ2_9ACTN|nr:hypothetical protein EKD16_06240 [Streptomonospora litoralis]